MSICIQNRSIAAADYNCREYTYSCVHAAIVDSSDAAKAVERRIPIPVEKQTFFFLISSSLHPLFTPKVSWLEIFMRKIYIHEREESANRFTNETWHTFMLSQGDIHFPVNTYTREFSGTFLWHL